MIRKGISYVLKITAGLALISGVAQADGHEKDGMHVSTGADSMKVTLESRINLEYNDNKLFEDDNIDPTATSVIALKRARLNFAGQANKTVSYRFRYDFLSAAINYGYVKADFGMVSVLTGYNKTLVGGVYRQNSGLYKIQKPEYHASKRHPFDGYQSVIQLGVKTGGVGAVHLQLLNDITPTSTVAAQWNENAEQPAWILAWKGSFAKGAWEPMITYGSYDINHSNFITVGLNGKVAGAMFAFDYIMDSRSERINDGSEVKDEFNVHTSISLDASYQVGKMLKPFLTYSMYDVKQHTDDAEANTDPTTSGSFDFNDNAQTITVGAWLTNIGKTWMPYLAITSKSGDFDIAGETENRSYMAINLGGASKF